MAWEELTSPTAELELRANGSIRWNTGLQLLMGAPEWVHVMWNPTDRTLGIRLVNVVAGGLPVHPEPEGSEFKIDSGATLEAAGISVDDNISAEPEMWYNNQSDASQPPTVTWFQYPPIYYITLPASGLADPGRSASPQDWGTGQLLEELDRAPKGEPDNG